jgi:nucleotide-binding universal stress UspA family protein
MKRYLAMHGIKARQHRYQDVPADAGAALLNAAADVSADLLVMGCYGHGRAREWMLGGATRTVLQSMTLPVLMCH